MKRIESVVGHLTASDAIDALESNLARLNA